MPVETRNCPAHSTKSTGQVVRVHVSEYLWDFLDNVWDEFATDLAEVLF